MEYTGVKIFSNSFSASVKREYRTIISFGIPDDETEAAVLDYYRDFQDGLYSGPFWLGLAQAEADCGRLSGRVKAAALAVLERGDDLKLWRQAVELEPDYKRMMKDRRLRTQWQRDLLFGIQKHDIDAARETRDEIIRAEHRTSATKNLVRRQAEHTALRAAMEQTQIPQKVSKPYFIPSPWQEGDIFWYRLRGLPAEYAAYEGLFAAVRVVAVRGRPISLARPDLGRNENITAGIYRWLGTAAPTLAELEEAEYLPLGSFMGTEGHGLWLSLYGRKNELKKQEWEVIGQTPNFSAQLPLFFKEGSLMSSITGFDEALARTIAEAMKNNNLKPPKAVRD